MSTIDPDPAPSYDQAEQADTFAPPAAAPIDYRNVERLTQAEVTALWRATFRRKSLREEETPIAKALGEALLVLVGIGAATYPDEYERGRAAKAARDITEMLS